MMGKPVVSILMAVYNTEEFLPAAIDSVIDQSYGNWELICINDGSTDDSLRLLNQYRDKNPRIIIIDRLHCGICANTRNAGLAIANGDYIAILDSDDKIESNYLEKLITRQQQTNVDIVISSMHYWSYTNNKISRTLTGMYGDISKIISGREAFVLSLHWEIGGIGLHRADTLKELKYCENVVWGDEYTTRLCFLQASTVTFCDAMYFYRENQNSDTRKFSYKTFLSIETRSLLLTLIRKNKFDWAIYTPFKEEIAMELVSNCIGFLKKQKLLTKMEKIIILSSLKRVTINLIKEFLLSPVSITSILNIVRQLHFLFLRRIKIMMSNLITRDEK